jgi:hypothetical protein
MFRIVLISIIGCLISCQPKGLPTTFEQKDGYVLVKLSHLTTKAEMTEIAEKAKEQQLVVDFEGSEFFEDGKLRNLKLKVTIPNGSGGMTSADLAKLQFKYWGFRYSRDMKPLLKIGEIVEETD